MTQHKINDDRSRSSRNYEELSVIGRGAYGTVFKAKDTENDRMVALKRVRVANTSDEKGVPISTLREITLLKQLDNLSHPNIVRMFDAFQTYSTSPTDSPTDLILTIVFEHVEQDLSQFLYKFQPPGLPEHLIKSLMYQLLSGIDYLHVNRLVHRDIKPQNILITKNKQLKIADFGLARVYDFNKLVTSVVVTLWYRAPEILLQQPYATMVDLWSIGTIMAEMYNRRPLFPGKGDVDELHKILSIIGCPSLAEWPENGTLSWDTFKKYEEINFEHIVPEMCPEGIDMLKRLLVFTPSKRINAHGCLKHVYFDDVDKESYSSNSNTTTATPNKNNTLTTNPPVCIKRSRTEMESVNCTESVNSEHSELTSYNDNDRNIHIVEKSDSSLDDEFSRSDSGLSDVSSTLSAADTKHRLDRVDSGICISPTIVISDCENSCSSEPNIYDREEMDKTEEKPALKYRDHQKKSSYTGYNKKPSSQAASSSSS